MRFHRIAPLLLGLALLDLTGCDTPSPRLMSGERHETTVAGSAFTVFRKGNEVEVYRTSPEFLPRLSNVMAKAEQAIRQTTGCTVKNGSMVGDAALMTALIVCR